MTDRISSRLLLLVCLLGRSIVVFSFSRNGIRSRRLRPRISVTATQLRSSNNEQGNPVARSAGEGALETVGTIGRNLSSGQDDLLSNQYFGTPEDSDSIQSIFSLADNRNIFQRSKQQLAKQNQQAEKQVWEALANLESDMQLLDRLAGSTPQLKLLELILLSSAVVASAGAPFILSGRLTEFVSPVSAAFTAAIGISAEYTGKVAVADGKEVAAASIQCAAESEGFLANAERAKAITPLCVGVGATAATLALLVPVLLDTLNLGSNLQVITQVYLLCPLVAVLAAAVAGLAVQEVRGFCNQAIGVGNRRFARSGLVGRTWLSSTEIIARKSQSSQSKWKTFSLSVLPAPLLGAIVPGALPTKTIVVAALAAAESAFYLARSEYMLARATDACALKARSAAVCDTYANQGMRSAAILPFTSALSGLCAAATAAIVELPFVDTLAEAGTGGTLLEALTVTIFPAFSALFAAAASVSKARCEVDAEAAMQAASTIALPYNDEEEDPILRPVKGVRELLRLTILYSIRRPLRQLFRRLSLSRRLRLRWLMRRRKPRCKPAMQS